MKPIYNGDREKYREELSEWMKTDEGQKWFEDTLAFWLYYDIESHTYNKVTKAVTLNMCKRGTW